MRAKVPVDWVPLSSVTVDPFGVVRSGWKLRWRWRVISTFEEAWL